MVGVEGIADWIGRDVVDRDGEKVGKLEDVYYDTADHEAAFVAVKSGTFGRSHTVAPLQGATLSREYVRLDAPKELLKDGPSEASGGRLTGVDALEVLRHFGLPGETDLEGEERVCFQTAGAAEETERKRAEVAAERARQEAAPAAAAAGSGSGALARESGVPAPARDPAGEPEPGLAPLAPADDDPAARLASLERRVSALERRLG